MTKQSMHAYFKHINMREPITDEQLASLRLAALPMQKLESHDKNSLACRWSGLAFFVACFLAGLADFTGVSTALYWCTILLTVTCAYLFAVRTKKHDKMIEALVQEISTVAHLVERITFEDHKSQDAWITAVEKIVEYKETGSDTPKLTSYERDVLLSSIQIAYNTVRISNEADTAFNKTKAEELKLQQRANRLKTI